jgi:hypothetical protein
LSFFVPHCNSNTRVRWRFISQFYLNRIIVMVFLSSINFTILSRTSYIMVPSHQIWKFKTWFKHITSLMWPQTWGLILFASDNKSMYNCICFLKFLELFSSTYTFSVKNFLWLISKRHQTWIVVRSSGVINLPMQLNINYYLLNYSSYKKKRYWAKFCKCNKLLCLKYFICLPVW